jgi:hypothetical protein
LSSQSTKSEAEAKPVNSASSQTKSEKTSTYWDGPSPFREKLPYDTYCVYNGPEGYLLVHVRDGRVYVHAGLLGPKTKSTFLRQREILEDFEVSLLERGITKYYTAIKTLRQLRYAEWLGFRLDGTCFVGTPFEIMEKDLT